MSTFGSNGPPGCCDDIENTDCFFLIGTNPAEMHPQAWRRIIRSRRSARAKDNRGRPAPHMFLK